jgi:hypothetical protein
MPPSQSTTSNAVETVYQEHADGHCEEDRSGYAVHTTQGKGSRGANSKRQLVEHISEWQATKNRLLRVYKTRHTLTLLSRELNERMNLYVFMAVNSIV